MIVPSFQFAAFDSILVEQIYRSCGSAIIKIPFTFSSAHHILEDSNCCYANQLTLVVAEAEAKFRLKIAGIRVWFLGNRVYSRDSREN